MSEGHAQKLTPVELIYPCSYKGCGKQAVVSAYTGWNWRHACTDHEPELFAPSAVSAVTQHEQP